jgi:hypothetical protein
MMMYASVGLRGRRLCGEERIEFFTTEARRTRRGDYKKHTLRTQRLCGEYFLAVNPEELPD